MKTTRILAIVIALSMLAVLCACNGGGSGNVTTPADDKTSAATPESTGAPATDAPTAPVTDAPTQPATDAPATSAEPVETDAPIPEPAQVNGVYQIASADDLLWVSTKGPLDGKYLLTADIEFNLTEGYEKWTIENTPKNTMTPIGNSVVPFSGTFDGGGHLITGLFVYGAGETGLFGFINGATIENLIIGEGLICSTDSNVGAFVGKFDGENNVIRNCINYANVTGNAYVGGIAGKYNSSASARLVIENCINHGNVTATKKSHALYVGGIIPAVVGVHVKSCANFGTVSAGIVGDASYAEKGCAILGGITGVMSGNGGDASIIDCYNKGDVISCNAGANSGTSAAAGIVGRMNTAGDSGATCVIKNCYSTGNVYTMSADSKELSASCSTKSGDDYAENVYASGRVLIWNTETENTNTFTPACGAPEVNTGFGATTAMNLDPEVWVDTADSTPILKSMSPAHQNTLV